MLTLDEARERVARGAAHLDQMRPGWHAEVDTGTLTLSSCTQCVLGQLFGGEWDVDAPFLHGLKCLNLYEKRGNASAVTHGFAIGTGDAADPDNAEPEFQWLQDAWIEAIAARRFPTVESARPQASEAVRA